MSTILAFYPHPKAIGYGIMDSPTSLKKSAYQYISAKDITSYVRCIASVIDLYQPNLIILEEEKSRNQYRLSHMRHVFDEIETMILQKKYPLVHYSRKQISSHFGGVNKPEIAQKITEVFPEYINRIPKQRVSTDGAESPAMSEFDALSLCMTHFAHQ